MRRIYLCGPIADRTNAQCAVWRDQARMLWYPGEVIDPLRRDYRGVRIDSARARQLV
jgi:hypothetical protein